MVPLEFKLAKGLRKLHYARVYKLNRPIGLIGRVFANGSGDWGSIPGRVISKTQKMVHDVSLFNTAL